MGRQIIQLSVGKSAGQEEQLAVESRGHLLCGMLVPAFHMEVKESRAGRPCSSPALFFGTLPLCLQQPGRASRHWQHVRQAGALQAASGYSQLLGERS